MKDQKILNYFAQAWEKVEHLSLERGLDFGFYPIALPEVDDFRLIDPSLPALKSRLGCFKAQITNPSAPQFEGLILEEITKENLEGDISIVNITYLQKGEVYSTQCLQETDPMMDHLKRYFIISPPRPANAPKKSLQKVYNELSSLLREQ